MKRTKWLPVVLAAFACATSGVASAQSKQGYWTEPAGGDAVWKSGSGLCWRAGHWTPALAIVECGRDLFPTLAASPPSLPLAPTPKRAPARAKHAHAPKPNVRRVLSTERYYFYRAALNDRAKT